MKVLSLFLSLSLCAATARGEEVMMGSTSFIIPAPAGYAALKDEMRPYAEVSRRFVVSSNQRLVLFLSDKDIAFASAGGIPIPQYQFEAQTTKSLIAPFISSAQFQQLKNAVKKENQQIIQKAQDAVANELDRMAKGIAADYDTELGMSVSKIIPFAPHHESERSMAYSMNVALTVEDADGKPTPHESVVTATFLHLKGKVFFTYVHATKDELEWSRQQAAEWATAIIAANPSSSEVAAREATSRTGFDWSAVLKRTLIGGAIGLVVTLVLLTIKQKKG